MPGMLSLVLFMIAAFAPALIGALFQPGEWYLDLVKPPWNPPAWLFGPVWTVLYVSIGVSGWLAWREQPRDPAFAVYALQLVLNAAWSWLFFGLHRPAWAFAEIVVARCSVARSARSMLSENPVS